MKDINHAVRTSFYQLLDGNITYNSAVIPVSDEQTKKDNTSNYYVILASQTSRPSDTKTSEDRQATITIDIVTKFNGSVTKNVADNIANQIFQLLFPSIPHKHNLPFQTGFQFLNVYLSDDRPLSLQLSPTQHLHRRILNFSLRVVY